MGDIIQRLHSRGPASAGIVVDAEGVMLGPDCVLVRHTTQGYRCIARDEAVALQKCLAADSDNADWLFGQCRRIAKALDRQDVPLAQILGLYMPVDELDAERLQRLALAAPFIKANFNPDEPRIPAGQPGGGQWTSGDSGREASDAGTSNANFIDAAYEERNRAAVVAGLADTPLNDASHNGSDDGLHLATSSDPFHDAVEDYLVRGFWESGALSRNKSDLPRLSPA